MCMVSKELNLLIILSSSVGYSLGKNHQKQTQGSYMHVLRGGAMSHMFTPSPKVFTPQQKPLYETVKAASCVKSSITLNF